MFFVRLRVLRGFVASRRRASSAPRPGSRSTRRRTCCPDTADRRRPSSSTRTPMAVRSRKLLKKAIAWLRPRSGLEVYAISSSSACRSRSVALTNRLPTALDRQPIDHRQPAAHRDLAPRLVDHHEVHERRHAGVGGAAGSLVLRDDQIDQHADGRVLVRGEELRLERRRRLRGLRAAVGVFVRLPRFERRPDQRRRGRRRDEELERRASGNRFHDASNLPSAIRNLNLIASPGFSAAR